MEIFIWIVCSILYAVGFFFALHYTGASFEFDFDNVGENAAKIFASIIIGFILGVITMLAWPIVVSILFIFGITVGIAFCLRWVFNRNR